MYDLMLEEDTKDLLIVEHDMTLTETNQKYVTQKLKIRLNMFLGEWYLNINKGIPYFEEILVKDPNLNFIEDLLKTEIVSIPEIDILEKFEIEYDSLTRELIITFIVRTIDGDVINITI